MAEQKNSEQARNAFSTLCQALDKQKWNYKKNEEALSIDCGVQGDDLPMHITVKVDADRMIALLISVMPFSVGEDKRLDVAIAVSAINNLLFDGSFDYDITSGRLYFRMTSSFLESKISDEVFEYMLYCSCQTVDEYNDKLLMLAKGMLSIEQFLSSLAN